MPKFDSRFSVGNILTIVIVVVGGIGTITRLEANHNNLKDRVERNERETVSSESRVMKRLDALHQDIREIRKAQMEKD